MPLLQPMTLLCLALPGGRRGEESISKDCDAEDDPTCMSPRTDYQGGSGYQIRATCRICQKLLRIGQGEEDRKANEQPQSDDGDGTVSARWLQRFLRWQKSQQSSAGN